jgi:thiamine-phosphate pyrophosphorylase
MSFEVTPAVERALTLGRALARQLEAAIVLPAHIFHSLLAEEEGQAGALAILCGLDVARYRAAAPQMPAEATAEAEAIPDLAPITREAFSRAREKAIDLTGDNSVNGEVLLLALLQTSDALRRDAATWGLRLEAVEERLTARQPAPLRLEEELHLVEPVEKLERGRILDACANRAREGLRVAEDYCRFVLNDNFLCGELKRLRHELTAVLTDLAPDFAAARDTPGDVGTMLTTPAEQHRHSLLEVALVNLKRAQEALRSLEEFGKVGAAAIGRRLEQLRYDAYTLEKAIVLGTTARQRLQTARLYVLLTGATCTASLEWTIAEAAGGGADVIQLREKELSDRDLLARAQAVRRWTRRAGVLFIVNDRPDIARLVEADGVHLGQDDLPVREARRIVGPDALIGVSTHDVEQLRRAILDGASYVGVGPTFPSGTKEFAELAGLDYVRTAMTMTSLPAFVLGGVKVANVAEAVAVGARRVAVSQAIAGADDPRAAAAALRRSLPG